MEDALEQEFHTIKQRERTRLKDALEQEDALEHENKSVIICSLFTIITKH